VHFGVRAWAVSASRFLSFRADQILMGFMRTEAALGIYAVAVNASEALLFLPFAIGSAIVP
jgi:O-antigen/teichoic acid export membrane protein